MKRGSDKAVRILLVDDHTLFREGLKLLLAGNSRFQVVGEAGSVEVACRKMGELRPDIVLMDIALPDGNGIEGSRCIRQNYPEAKVIIISMHSKIDYVIQSLQVGAVGFLVKDTTPGMLVRALDTVAGGHYYFDHTVTEEIVRFLVEKQAGAVSVSEPNYDRLTRREQEIMRLVAQGLTTRQIAEQLCISPKTVENHRTKVMEKMGFETIVDLVKYSARLGIINLRTS